MDVILDRGSTPLTSRKKNSHSEFFFLFYVCEARLGIIVIPALSGNLLFKKSF